MCSLFSGFGPAILESSIFYILSYIILGVKTFAINISAVTEARDITLHLKPLVKHFEVLENTDFRDVLPLLRPLVHCVALVWANSHYYRTSAKIITLVREIANLLIQEV
jgi:dynein heavy chain